jgi:hypothetical protein
VLVLIGVPIALLMVRPPKRPAAQPSGEALEAAEHQDATAAGHAPKPASEPGAA